MSASAPARSLPREIFRANKWRLLLTYALFNVENIIALLQPAVLGFAINGLLRDDDRGLMWFVAQHIAHVAIGSARRAYDTRCFSRIVARLATNVVTASRAAGGDVSTVAARAALSRELVDFYEIHVPTIVASLYAMGGGLVMLLFYDPTVAAMCVCLLAPVVVIQRRAWGPVGVLMRKINDRYEREINVIERGGRRRVAGHFQLLSRWRVRLSDIETRNFAMMEAFVLVVMAAALIRFCANPLANPGSIFSVFVYVITFVSGMDTAPMLMQAWSRIRDISRRVGAELPAEGLGA